MKSMTWSPDDHDREASLYLDQMNHAPYFTLGMLTVGIFCAFTFFVLMGAF